MTITIGLSSEEEIQLRARAMQTGQDLAAYIRGLIAKDLHLPERSDRALAPFRRQVEESGLSDSDLEALFEEAREEIWAEKQNPPEPAPGQ